MYLKVIETNEVPLRQGAGLIFGWGKLLEDSLAHSRCGHASFWEVLERLEPATAIEPATCGLGNSENLPQAT